MRVIHPKLSPSLPQDIPGTVKLWESPGRAGGFLDDYDARRRFAAAAVWGECPADAAQEPHGVSVELTIGATIFLRSCVVGIPADAVRFGERGVRRNASSDADSSRSVSTRRVRARSERDVRGRDFLPTEPHDSAVTSVYGGRITAWAMKGNTLVPAKQACHGVARR